MAEYINREALRAKAVYMHGFGENKYVPLKAIENAPAADVEVVKHGRWLYVDGKGTNAEYECEECRGHVCFDEKIDGSIPHYKRCPNCGAKMDGGAD